ncbi:MAG: Smr/MutS family protein [Proteobacteria bacterium]|nr:Smr/MutS family protein [Pseudomonadota bacterium]
MSRRRPQPLDERGHRMPPPSADRAGDAGREATTDAAFDADAFAAAVGPVRRLPAVAPPPRPPRRRPMAVRDADEAQALAQSRRIDPQALAQALGEIVECKRPDVPPELLRRLRSGQFVIDDEIDLHGLDAEAAEAALRGFLAQSQQAGKRCLRIVHGRGWHSRQGPVLRGVVERILHQRADVLAFASAPPAAGGNGAVLALLARRARPQPH